MFTIKKARAEDFELVYPLLQSFNNPNLSRTDWKKIFVNHFHASEDYCGLMLLKDEQVKGYLGLIFSSRTINERPEKFCNLTSWIVNEDCRGHGLSLLLEVLRLKDYTITNFTPSGDAEAVMAKLGFTAIEIHQQVLFPLPRPAFGRSPYHCYFKATEIRERLGPIDVVIFNDHQNFDCQHVLLTSDQDYCYVITKKTWRKHLPFAKVHYLSNRDLFVRSIESLKKEICWRLGVVGIMVDYRYVGGHEFKHSFRYPHEKKAYFKSPRVEVHAIDTVYSELVVLHN
jgi:hypothetical protein